MDDATRMDMIRTRLKGGAAWGAGHRVSTPTKGDRPPLRLPVLDLGVAPYEAVQDLQGRLRDRVAEGDLDGVLLLLEHEPVITLGTRAGRQDLRMSDLSLPEIHGPGRFDQWPHLSVADSERGGRATLHAPGQLVSYPIVPIPRRNLSAYVRDLEEVLIVLLEGLGIAAMRVKGCPGVYVGEDKIASVGLRCQRWVASHGTSLNVDIDLSRFDLIVSCGDPALRQTSVKKLTAQEHTMGDIKARYLQAARAVFRWEWSLLRTVSYDQVEEVLGL